MSHANVFILPGLLEDADAFEPMIEALRGTASCLVADLTRGDSVAQLARDALEKAGEAPISLLGHSMGGYVALEIMRTHPGRVARLALLNTHARPDTPEATETRKRLVALADKDFEGAVNTVISKAMTEKHLQDPVLAGTLGAMALAVGKEAFKRQQTAIMGRPDSRPGLGRIACPTLVVAGREDAIMPLDVLRELADGIPGARLAIVEDCGHTAPLEQPEEITRLLREWLKA